MINVSSTCCILSSLLALLQVRLCSYSLKMYGICEWRSNVIDFKQVVAHASFSEPLHLWRRINMYICSGVLFFHEKVVPGPILMRPFFQWKHLLFAIYIRRTKNIETYVQCVSKEQSIPALKLFLVWVTVLLITLLPNALCFSMLDAVGSHMLLIKVFVSRIKP